MKTHASVKYRKQAKWESDAGGKNDIDGVASSSVTTRKGLTITAGVEVSP